MNQFLFNQILSKKTLFLYRLLCFSCLVVSFSLLQAKESSAQTYFLDMSSWNFSKILPPPALQSSAEQKKELHLVKDAMAASTKKQIIRATRASSDDVFDYAMMIHPDRNFHQLPHTSTLFKKIHQDTKVAIKTAKNYFHCQRPITWKSIRSGECREGGYAYPSGHSTKAFLWAALLVNLFPEQKKIITKEARRKAWNRVILGRHYPDDVYGGELYGKYLAQQFLKNPTFQKEWVLVKQELKNHQIK